MKRLSVFIIFLSSLLFAQNGAIKGKVVESLSGKPIANVNIRVVGTPLGTATNDRGDYFLPNLEQGTITLEFSAVGYKTKKLSGIKIEPGQTEVVNIELSPSAIKGEEIVITATRRPTLLKDVPEVTMALTKQEITITTPADVGEAISYLPGANVEMGTMGGLPTKKNVSIDGLPAQYSIILLDGTRVLSSHFHTGADVNVIPPENIERIELVKGATSAQYGSDGMGGVLNIITKRGTENTGLQFTAYHGTQNTSHFSLSAGGKVANKVFNNVFAGWEQSDGPAIIEPVRRVGLMNYNLFHLMDKIDADLSEKASIGAQIFYMTMTYPVRSATKYRSWLATPKLEFRYALSENITLNTSAYYSQWNSERNSELNEIGEPEITLDYTGIRNNRILLGAEYIYRKFNRVKVPLHEQNAFGIFLQDEWAPTEKISLLGALRMDKVEGINAVFTPKLTTMFKPVNRLRLRLSVGRGFRAPSIQDLYETLHGHPGDLNYRAGNKNLKPEYSTGVTGGIEFEPLATLSIMANGYYTALTDMITPVNHGLENPYNYFTPEEIPDWNPADTLVYIYRRENIHRATIYGGEVKTQWNFIGDFYIEAFANITENKNEETGKTLPYYPGMSFGGRLYGTQAIAKWLNLSASVGLNAYSGRKIWLFKEYTPTGEPQEQQIDLEDYQNLNASLTFTLHSRFEIFARASNLLGQEIVSYEDVLFRLEGKPQYFAGVRIKAF